MLDLSLKL